MSVPAKIVRGLPKSRKGDKYLLIADGKLNNFIVKPLGAKKRGHRK